MSAKRPADKPVSGPPQGPSHHVSVRLNRAITDRVDALIPALSTSWRPAKRSDVLRALIDEGLEAFEARHAAKPKGRRGSEPDA